MLFIDFMQYLFLLSYYFSCNKSVKREIKPLFPLLNNPKTIHNLLIVNNYRQNSVFYFYYTLSPIFSFPNNLSGIGVLVDIDINQLFGGDTKVCISPYVSEVILCFG